MKTLILGASGYIGSNVLHAHNPDQTILVTRKSLPGYRHHAVDLSAERLSKKHALFKELPDVVLYLSRPTNADFDPYRVFHSNVQNLLMKWCENPDFKGVQFASTTMVYTGETPILREDDKQLTTPCGVYEYFKLESELFLKYLSTSLRPDAFFNIWRLPIVFGGFFDFKRHHSQFLYDFYRQYQDGHAWQFFRPEDTNYGTSWVYLPDLVNLLTAATPNPSGCHIKNVASGFFTYQDLHNLFVQKLATVGNKPLKLLKTRFEVRDEGGLPQMTIDQAFDSLQFS